jgi:hypothetical protein
VVAVRTLDMAGCVTFRPAWWQWPTVLSLDAPVVSVVWLALLAPRAPHGLVWLWPQFVVLGSSVWLAYAADRWIEGWRLPTHVVRTQRHIFYQRWRWPVSAAWLLTLSCSIGIAVTALPKAEIVGGMALTACVIAYLVSHQFLHRDRRWRVPKEICIACLLTAGTAVSLLGVVKLGVIAVPLFLLASICFANCVLISSWERDIDRAHGQSSLALQRHVSGLIPWTPWVLMIAAACLTMRTTGVTQAAAACVGASALLLAVIDRSVSRIGWASAHVLADAALLTPIVWLVWRP